MATQYKLAPQFINYFRNKDGTPLTIDGYLYTYKATSHVTPKLIYEDSDGLIPYDWPTPVDSAGAIKAIYWADDEQYYVELYKGLKGAGGQLITSQDNYPDETEEPDVTGKSIRNYSLNPQFLYHHKESYATADLLDNVDNYIAEEGWVYRRNNTSGNVQINFETFTPGQTVVPYNPEYYIRFRCNGAGTGENESDIAQKFIDVSNFSGQEMSFGFYGISPTNSTIQLLIIQYFGSTGDVEVTTLNNFELNSAFEQYKLEGLIIPSISGKNIQEGNAIYIGWRMPLNSVSDVGLTNFQINRGNELLIFDKKSSDEENISKKSYQLPTITDNDVYSPVVAAPNGRQFIFGAASTATYQMSDLGKLEGHLLCDGSSFSTLNYVTDPIYGDTKVKYKRLYDVWENDTASTANGNRYGWGDDGFSDNAFYTSNIVFVNTKTDTNITDWSDNNTTFTFAKVREGGDKGFIAFKGFYFEQSDGDGNKFYAPKYKAEITNKSNGNVTNASAGTSPFTITVLQEGSGINPEKIEVLFTDATTITGAQYWLISSTTTDYYIWYKKDGVGTDPAVAARTGLLVEINGTDTAVQVMNRSIFAILGTESTKITTVPASSLTGGEYFNFYNSIDHYVGYITIDGIGTDPEVASTTSVEIALFSSDTAAQVADKLRKIIKSIFFQLPDWRGMAFRATDNGRGLDPNAADRYDRGDGISGDAPGTIQRDQNRDHRHSFYKRGLDISTATLDSSSQVALASKWYTTSNGGDEARMVNANLNWFIKY